LASHFVVDAYDPEIERYGGPAAIADAERAFQADSETCLCMLQIAESAAFDLDPLILAAASLVDLLSCFTLGIRGVGEGWFEWLGLTGGRGNHRDAFTARRQAAVAIIDPDRGWPELRSRPYGEALIGAWNTRRVLMEAYGRKVNSLATAAQCWTGLDQIALSLLHMHSNRLMGNKRTAESRALAIARGALEANRNRVRFTS
jgi:thiopeptide-type bacteriocin biosynthesis protein